MIDFIFANNFSTTLSAAATSGGTSLVVASTTNLPTLAVGQTFPVTLNDAATGKVYEICYATAISSNTLTVTRGQEGTAAVAWNIGDYIYGAITAGSMDQVMSSTELFQTVTANPNGSLGGTAGSVGQFPSMAWDTSENTLWVCTTSGTATTAVWSRQSLMQVYAGNPNGNIAGTAGTAGGASPTMVWDTTHDLLWVCATTGTATTAVWVSAGAGGAQPTYWCGTSTGTANAQTVTPPAGMLSMTAGTGISFKADFTNTDAMTLTVGTFGTFAVEKDSPTGPIALTGGEVVAGNILAARYDGTNLQLMATELGTASLQNASSSTGIVAAVSGSGSITPGHLATFADASGTLQDGGLPGAAGAPTYINTSQTIGPGVYLVDTSAGAITLTLGAALSGAYVFIDAQNTWGTNNLTINGNGHNIGNKLTNVAATFLANVSDYQFTIEASSTYWRLV